MLAATSLDRKLQTHSSSGHATARQQDGVTKGLIQTNDDWAAPCKRDHADLWSCVRLPQTAAIPSCSDIDRLSQASSLEAAAFALQPATANVSVHGLRAAWPPHVNR
jgi:hypothetical protein